MPETFQSFCNEHGLRYVKKGDEELAVLQTGDLYIEVTGHRPDWTVTVKSAANGSKLLSERYDAYYHARDDAWTEQRRSIKALLTLLRQDRIRVVPESARRNVLQHKAGREWVVFTEFYDFFE
jgi:hypothetical protein